MVQKFTTTQKELPDIGEFLFKLWRKGVRIAPSFRPLKGFCRLAAELKGKVIESDFKASERALPARNKRSGERDQDKSRSAEL